ncbi:MAG: outer membrane beta-barrel protein [Hyphomicrobium sp.]
MGALLAGDRKIVGITYGFAALAGVGLALACAFYAGPATAQILDPPGWHPEQPRKPRLRPSMADDSSPLSEEDRRAFDSGAFGAEPQARTQASGPAEDGIAEPGDALRPSLDDDSAGGDAGEGGLSGAEGDSGDALPLRRALQDGDPIPAIEEAAQQDGNIDLADPAATVEAEEDITEVDMRSPEDVRAFVNEPGGYDPLLLQAEETNPVFSPGTFQGFAFDPFPAIGTKIGSFLLFTTVEADYDFNNNLFAAPDAVGDSSLEVRPAARLASNWSRHALELRASGDLSYHNQFPSEDDRAYMVQGLGRLDVTSYTNFQGLVAHEFAQEGRSAINASSIGTRPNIEVTRLRGAFNQRFNRLSVQLRGNIIDTSYSTNVVDGQVVSNADRNYTLYEQAVRPKWEFSPYLFAFSDISFNQRDYGLAAFSGPHPAQLDRRALPVRSVVRRRRRDRSRQRQPRLRASGTGQPRAAAGRWPARRRRPCLADHATDGALAHGGERRRGDDDDGLARRHGAQLRARSPAQLYEVSRRQRGPCLHDAQLRRHRHQRGAAQRRSGLGILPQSMDGAVCALSAHRIPELAARQQLQHRRSTGGREIKALIFCRHELREALYAAVVARADSRATLALPIHALAGRRSGDRSEGARRPSMRSMASP